MRGGEKTLKFTATCDGLNKSHYIIKSEKGGELTITAIHNAIVNEFGGGYWVLLLNCNDDKDVERISEIEYEEANEKYFE